jgi:hypothetical protein
MFSCPQCPAKKPFKSKAALQSHCSAAHVKKATKRAKNAKADEKNKRKASLLSSAATAAVARPKMQQTASARRPALARTSTSEIRTEKRVDYDSQLTYASQLEVLGRMSLNSEDLDEDAESDEDTMGDDIDGKTELKELFYQTEVLEGTGEDVSATAASTALLGKTQAKVCLFVLYLNFYLCLLVLFKYIGDTYKDSYAEYGMLGRVISSQEDSHAYLNTSYPFALVSYRQLTSHTHFHTLPYIQRLV